MSTDSVSPCPRCGARVSTDATHCGECGLYMPAGGERPEAWIGRVVGGKYALESVLGIGGMGMVFRARRVLVGDEVALKVLYPRFLESPLQRKLFHDEAVAAARLAHPNVVTVFDADLTGDGGVAYIAMELLHGAPLKRLLRDRAPLTLGESLPIFVQICDGLAAAHDARVVHRDLKPDNVFLEQRAGAGPRVKLVDFGIAAMLDVDGHEEQRRLMGTLRYMAPEQCRGEPAGPRADLYALGVILYEALTRRRATGRTVSAILADPVVAPNELLPPDRALPQPLEDVVLRLLAKHPEERPASALEVREILQAWRPAKASSRPDAARAPSARPDVVPAPVARAEGELALPARPAAARPSSAPVEARVVAAADAQAASRPGRGLLWLGLGIAALAGVAGGVIWTLLAP